jgi:hypothetical protein
MPTRLSELNVSQIDVIVNNGIVGVKKAFLSNNHVLTYQIRI